MTATHDDAPDSAPEHNGNNSDLIARRAAEAAYGETATVQDVAARFRRSVSWTRRHWREIDGFPQPFVGGELYQHALWRRADIDAFMAGKRFSYLAEKTVAATDRDNQMDSSLRHSRLLAGAGQNIR